MPFFTFFPPDNDMWEDWVYFENLFSQDECDAVIKVAHEYPEVKAGVGGTPGHTNEEVRNSIIRWVPWSQETDWIYQKLSNTVNGCNNIRYKFDLDGFMEDIQFTQYFTGGHYRWHMDFGSGSFAKRKLSMVVQLTDPEEYEGGELQIFNGYETTAPRGLGSAIIFPSFMQHRVLPVTKGTRYSMVIWTSGPPLK